MLAVRLSTSSVTTPASRSGASQSFTIVPPPAESARAAAQRGMDDLIGRRCACFYDSGQKHRLYRHRIVSQQEPAPDAVGPRW